MRGVLLAGPRCWPQTHWLVSAQHHRQGTRAGDIICEGRAGGEWQSKSGVLTRARGAKVPGQGQPVIPIGYEMR
eukprot:13636965-Alexandrium_andersonii.AAC.1